jgi:four helix bundle protein
MGDQAEQLQERSMQFAVDVCALVKLLPRDETGPTVRHQLAKSATSTAMNYRSSRRARSHAEYTSRIGIVADEADESLGSLEFVQRAKLVTMPCQRSRGSSAKLVSFATSLLRQLARLVIVNRRSSAATRVSTE